MHKLKVDTDLEKNLILLPVQLFELQIMMQEKNMLKLFKLKCKDKCNKIIKKMIVQKKVVKAMKKNKVKEVLLAELIIIKILINNT